MILYKYLSLATKQRCGFAKDIIVNNRLYLALVKNFNDPFEYDFTISTEMTEVEEAASIFEGKPPDVVSYDANRFFDHIRETAGVLSLTAKPDDILMWSHYADGHKGICIKFEIRDTPSLLRKAKPVNYQSNLPIFNASTFSKEVFERALLTKSDRWAYEQEWRVIDPKNGNTAISFPSHLLKGIILGCNISSEHKALITKWVKKIDPPIQLYEACRSKTHYALDIV